jgi:hypothetical protein
MVLRGIGWGGGGIYTRKECSKMCLNDTLGVDHKVCNSG